MLEASTLRPRRAVRVRRLGLRVTAVALVLAGLAAVPAGRALLHRDATMPGVQVLGADVSGLPADEAGLRIRSLTAERLRQPVGVMVESRRVDLDVSRLFLLDREATAEAAMRAGRGSWAGRVRSLLHPLTAPVDVAPVLVPRRNAPARLGAQLAGFGTPPVSAAVELRGTEPVVTPAKPGTRPDVESLLAALPARVAAGEGVLAVDFAAAAPAVGDAAARVAADEAQLVLSSQVRLTFEGEPVGSLRPARLAELLSFREHGDRLLVLLDEERLADAVAPAVAPFTKAPVDATFAVDGTRAEVVPATPGTQLDRRAAAVAVTTAAHRREDRAAALTLAPLPARLTTEQAAALGIRERVSTFTTEMGVSSENRIHNVHLMADYIDGTIVRPGETFSFNDRVGPRTAERGFREGQMIVGSLLLPSIGGGVCQTATTLFNNAFELGLPIESRSNHSFYIDHYPVGRDATVAWGGPDLVFRNDTANALLIKASYTRDTLTFTFYGTPEGRTVESRTGERTNWREPKLTYALDPSAPQGSVRVVEGTRQRGFDVTVYRTVTKDGKLLREDSFTSRYIAVGDTAIYGPGREIPGEYFVIPST